MRMKLETDFELKSVDDTGHFAGYGSVFGVKDSYGDIVEPGAFKESLRMHKAEGRFPAMLWQHDTSEPIGVYTDMKEDGKGLFVEGRLLIEDDQVAKRAHAHLKAGSLSGLSIGYSLPEDGFEYDESKDAYLLKTIDLWEVSLVTFPANDQARVSDVKRMCQAGECPPPKLVERVLRDAGFSVKQAKTLISGGYSALNPRDVGEGVEVLEDLFSKLRGTYQ